MFIYQTAAKASKSRTNMIETRHPCSIHHTPDPSSHHFKMTHVPQTHPTPFPVYQKPLVNNRSPSHLSQLSHSPVSALVYARTSGAQAQTQTQAAVEARRCPRPCPCSCTRHSTPNDFNILDHLQLCARTLPSLVIFGAKEDQKIERMIQRTLTRDEDVAAVAQRHHFSPSVRAHPTSTPVSTRRSD